ncbi:MAG: electron transport complex subunit E [Candidatus Krumholzibacteriota bacterium]|nr:electron transport complex subunit E [Candidatus Krumholzibacteriota bacterium]
MTAGQIFIRGLWKENPIFRLVLGMCPTLAVTTSVVNGMGMGLASTFVLICSNGIIALLRGFIPKKVRIPAFIVIIATFVTIVDLVMHGFFYDLHRNLGLFIPLIVVNCVILGRAEAFASRNGVGASLLDGLSMGLGFTLSLMLLGAVREILGNGSLLGYTLFGPDFPPLLVMVLPPGAFVALGFLMAGINKLEERRAIHAGEEYAPPREMDCGNCVLCRLGEGDDGGAAA